MLLSVPIVTVIHDNYIHRVLPVGPMLLAWWLHATLSAPTFHLAESRRRRLPPEGRRVASMAACSAWVSVASVKFVSIDQIVFLGDLGSMEVDQLSWKIYSLHTLLLETSVLLTKTPLLSVLLPPKCMVNVVFSLLHLIYGTISLYKSNKPSLSQVSRLFSKHISSIHHIHDFSFVPLSA